NRLREHVNEAARGGGNQTHLAESTVLLLTCVDDVLAGRRPCFIPAWEDSAEGPFGAISREILGVLTEEAWILRPTYLSFESPSIGFMRLDHASPSVLNGRSTKGAKDKVRDIMSILRSAAHNVKRHGH